MCLVIREGNLLFVEELGMDPDDEGLFIIASVADADIPPIRKILQATPEIVMIQIFGGRALNECTWQP